MPGNGKIRAGRNGERGQATMELVICMLGLLTVTLGVVCIGGLAISNVKVLSTARSNAEFLSHSSSSGGLGNEIGSWYYGEDGVPFSLDDRPSSNTTAAVSPGAFSDASASMADRMTGRNNGYIFQGLPEVSYLPGNDRNFTTGLGSAGYQAADLVMAIGWFGGESVYTLDTSRHGAARISPADTERFKELFGNLVGRDISGVSLSGHRSNYVYFPALGL